MGINLTNKQKQFIRESKEVWNFKIGAVRSGKSYEDIAYEIIAGIRERAGLDGLNVIMGVSKSTIERNVLKPMREIYTSALVGNINSQNICYIAGEEVYCVGAEKQSQVSKIQGSSIKYCYGDEVAKWNEEVFTMLESRLDKPYSRFSGSANPEHPQHWLKKFIDNPSFNKYIQEYVIFDNPYLPKEYVERLCKQYEGTVYYDRYILGKWKRAEGICYQLLADNNERYTIEKAKLPRLKNFVFAVDFGGTKSYHTFCCTAYDNNWNVYGIKSKRVNPVGMTAEELTNEFIKFVDDLKHEYKFTYSICYCDSAEQTLENSFKNASIKYKLGCQVKDAKKSAIKDRIELINRLCACDMIKFVAGECNSEVEALSTCVYDDKSFEDKRLDNGTTDIDSCDAFEYSVESYADILISKMTKGV